MQGFQIILTPFVWLLMFFYNLFNSYGIALILFAIVVKLILFPFSLKGKRSMIQMNMLNGQMQKLQKQYGKDKERYNQELQRLYEKEHVNPMSSCLWSFIPLLILLPLYAIIRQPLTYMMNLTPDMVGQVAAALDWPSVAFDMGWVKEAGQAFVNNGYNQLYLASLITPENVQQVAASLGDAGSKMFAVNFQFLGLNLSQIPNVKFWEAGGFGLFLIPVISAATGFIFSLISMKTNAVNSQSAQAANNPSSKMMLLMSPLMSLWIGFIMPAGLGIYWIAQNLLSMLQEFISGKMLKQDYAKAAEAKAEQERQEKEDEKRKKQEAAEERARRIEEAKQNKGKKKPAPKKRKDEEDETIPASVKEASRVGMRQYARGRAYDPNRYGEGPTEYREPGAPIDEEAIDRALKKKAEHLEEVAAEAAVDDEIVDSLVAEQAAVEAPEESPEEVSHETPAVTDAPAFETPVYDAPDYDAEAEAPDAEAAFEEDAASEDDKQ